MYRGDLLFVLGENTNILCVCVTCARVLLCVCVRLCGLCVCACVSVCVSVCALACFLLCVCVCKVYILLILEDGNCGSQYALKNELFGNSRYLRSVTRYPFYRRLGGPQGRSGWAENLVPTGIPSRIVQPVVSPYTG